MAPDPNHHCAATEELQVIRVELDTLRRELAQLRGRTKQHRPERARRKKDPPVKLPKARNRGAERKGLSTRTVRRQVAENKRAVCRCGCRDVVDVRHVENTVTDMIPATVVKTTYVDEVIRFACGHEVSSELPTKVTEGGDYGPALVADVVVSKCEESTPIFRQAKRFARMGLPMARSTLTDLFHQAARALTPIYEHLLALVALQSLVQADETSFKVQAPGKCRTGYMWTFVTCVVIAYCFRPSRSGSTPREILGKAEEPGTLLVDGHTGYNAVVDVDGWTRAGCQAHGRRRFFDAEGQEADEALEFFRAMYRVEHFAEQQRIKGTAEHLRLRRTVSLAYFREFHRWLIRKRGMHPPSTQMGNAIRYALKNRAAWMRIFRDAAIPLDNNASESALRVVALLRKNAMFVGHDESGQNHAVLMSLIATCKLHGVNAMEYLTDVLLRVQTHPARNMADLLPQNWKAARVAERALAELPQIA